MADWVLCNSQINDQQLNKRLCLASQLASAVCNFIIFTVAGTSSPKSRLMWCWLYWVRLYYVVLLV